MPEKRDDGLLFHPQEFDDLVLPSAELRTPVVPGTVEGLAHRIARDGQLMPGIVRPSDGGRYELIDGRRRLLAKRLIAADPARFGVLVAMPYWAIERHLTDEEAVAVALGANHPEDRKFDPVDQAFCLRTLIEHYHYAPEKAREKLDLSEGRAAQLLSLFRLPQPTLQILIEGWMGDSNGRELLPPHHYSAEQAAAWKERVAEWSRQVLAKEMSVEAMLELAEASKASNGTIKRRKLGDLRAHLSKSAKLSARVLELWIDGLLTDDGIDRFLNMYPDPKAEMILDQCRIDTDREAA